MGIKEFFARIKESNKNFAQTTKRINATGFCGNVDRGVKGGDFGIGAYVSIIDGKGVIYSTGIDDYIFTGSDIEKFELMPGTNVTVSSGKEQRAALRYKITFKDGKTALADLLVDKIDMFKSSLSI